MHRKKTDSTEMEMPYDGQEGEEMETVLPFRKCFMSLLKGDLLIKAALMLIETMEMREHGAPGERCQQ